MDDRTGHLRREIEIYRALLEEGVEPELERHYIEKVVLAELELQLIALRGTYTLH